MPARLGVHTMHADSPILHRALHREQSPIHTMAGGQRTDDWLELRSGRLTASAFSEALGFWDRNGDKRVAQLWAMKTGLAPPQIGGWNESCVMPVGNTQQGQATHMYLHIDHILLVLLIPHLCTSLAWQNKDE